MNISARLLSGAFDTKASSTALTLVAGMKPPATPPVTLAKETPATPVAEKLVLTGAGLSDELAWHPPDLKLKAELPNINLPGNGPKPGGTGGGGGGGGPAANLPRTYLPAGVSQGWSGGAGGGKADPRSALDGFVKDPTGGAGTDWAKFFPDHKLPAGVNGGDGDDAPAFNIPGVEAPAAFPTSIEELVPNHRAAPSKKKDPVEPAKPAEPEKKPDEYSGAYKPNAADDLAVNGPIISSDDAKDDTTKPDPNAKPNPFDSSVRPADDGNGTGGPVDPRWSTLMPADDGGTGSGGGNPWSSLARPADDGNDPGTPRSLGANAAASTTLNAVKAYGAALR